MGKPIIESTQLALRIVSDCDVTAFLHKWINQRSCITWLSLRASSTISTETPNWPGCGSRLILKQMHRRFNINSYNYFTKYKQYVAFLPWQNASFQLVFLISDFKLMTNAPVHSLCSRIAHKIDKPTGQWVRVSQLELLVLSTVWWTLVQSWISGASMSIPDFPSL